MHEIIKITNGVKLNKFLWSKYCIHLMLGTTNEKSTQHTPTILKEGKEKHKKMSKVNTIIGNYFKYGGLTSEPSFSKLLIYSQYSTHYSHKMTQLQKINYITKRQTL